VAFVKAAQGAMQAQSAAVAPGVAEEKRRSKASATPSALCICLFPQAGPSLQ